MPCTYSTERNWKYPVLELSKTVCALTLYRPVFTTYTDRLKFTHFKLLPTQCIYVLCVDLRTNSDYFPIQH